MPTLPGHPASWVRIHVPVLGNKLRSAKHSETHGSTSLYRAVLTLPLDTGASLLSCAPPFPSLRRRPLVRVVSGSCFVGTTNTFFIWSDMASTVFESAPFPHSFFALPLVSILLLILYGISPPEGSEGISCFILSHVWSWS